MSISDFPENTNLDSQMNLTADNERSLQQLSWAIEMSEGQFKLIFSHCNYIKFRHQLMTRLQEIDEGEIRTIELGERSQSLLREIEEMLGEDIPNILVLLGLEKVEELDRFWGVTDRSREEIRQRCPFPILIWLDDRTLESLMQNAPNFESFGTTKRFKIAPDELIAWVRQTADFQFDRMLEMGAERSIGDAGKSAATQMLSGAEFAFAQRDLTQAKNGDRDLELDATLEADLEFLLGRAADPLAQEAQQHFDRSLTLWRELGNWEREACLRYCLGIWWRNRAVRDRREFETGCDRARQYFEECVAGFEAAGRSDLVAKFINAVGDVLQRLECPDALETLGRRALALHQTYDNPFRRARSLGFLARVAIAKQKWQEARQFAQAALSALELGASSSSTPSYHRSEYLFLLATARQQLGERQQSLANLEEALTQMQPESEPELYVQILEALRSGYYEAGDYPKAFEYKQQRRSIEQQFGLRAFLGAGRLQARREAQLGEASLDRSYPKTIAPEIIASGRQPDVERLVARMGDNHSKVTVLYGYSGVGKSSLVTGGLVPALKRKPIGFRDALPVVVRSYRDWLGELGQLLGEALAERGISPEVPLESEAAILAQLRENEERNLLTVLIFDQFEEFFFQYSRRNLRNPLFEFLGKAMEVLSLKLIFSLRRDYLHHLLNRPGFDRIDNDILSRHVLYKIGNFSSEEARAIVEEQTERANFPVQPDLIDALVADLDAGYGKVRPIELQVVGAQLQEENITTLAAYRQHGPKKALVRRYLDMVVDDCGREYRQVAELVLFLLTDEKKFRPAKTRSELAADLQKLGIDAELSPSLPVSPSPRLPISPLNWILTVCTGSGLVQEVPGKGELRYQLVHDYIASSIRKQHELKLVREREQIKISLRFFEERFRAIFKQDAVGIAIGNADGRFIQINQKTCDILGYTADELRMKTRLDPIVPQERQPYLDRIEALFRGEIDSFSIELQLIHKEGHTVWVNKTVSMLNTRDSNPEYDVAIFEDISDRKRMEREQLLAQRQREEAEQVLAISRWKARWQVLIGSAILAVTVLAASGIWVFSSYKVADANQKQKKAEEEAALTQEKVNRAQQDVQIAIQDLDTVREDLEIALQDKEKAEKEAQDAQEYANAADREASKKIEEADAAVADAEMRASQAEERVEQAKQGLDAAKRERERVVVEAQQLVLEANQQVAEAEKAIVVAEAERQMADMAARDAEAQVQDARREIEQRTASLNQLNAQLNQAQNQLDLAERTIDESLGNILSRLEQQTGQKSAIIYVRFLPTEQEEKQLELWLVTAEGQFNPQTSKLTEENIATVINQFKNQFQLGGGVIGEDFWRSSKLLYQWIIQPVEGDLEIQEIDNLIFLVDPIFRSLPFAALHNGKKFLIEKYSIGVMPGFLLMDTRYVNIQNTNILALGISESRSNFSALPFVENELNDIQAIWSGLFLLNSESTLDNLKLNLKDEDFKILHLATHAWLEENSDDSFINLWDRLLDLEDLLKLDFGYSPIELLVLSSCETGLGNEENLFGFAGAALQRGAKSVLASLFNVKDRETAIFMSRFYHHLKIAPTKSEALRQAQLDMLRGEVSDEFKYFRKGEAIPVIPLNDTEANIVHPYYWASFTIIGNPW